MVSRWRRFPSRSLTPTSSADRNASPSTARRATDDWATATGWWCSAGCGRRQTTTSDRLRQERIGYFFDVITNGFGAMQGYAEQVPVRDRWLIAAYVRALQYSQNASVERRAAGAAC